MAEKYARPDKSDTKMDTEAGGEVGTSQSHMTNIYMKDSDEEAVVDFVKDHEEWYNKTNEHFKDKTRKESKFGQAPKEMM